MMTLQILEFQFESREDLLKIRQIRPEIIISEGFGQWTCHTALRYNI